MLLIEVHGKRILYSGDFRTHGRKSALTRRLMAAPPEKLDVLLMEGTNLGSDKSCTTESNLEDAFVRSLPIYGRPSFCRLVRSERRSHGDSLSSLSEDRENIGRRSLHC